MFRVYTLEYGVYNFNILLDQCGICRCIVIAISSVMPCNYTLTAEVNILYSCNTSMRNVYDDDA